MSNEYLEQDVITALEKAIAVIERRFNFVLPFELELKQEFQRQLTKITY
ncbi:MAG: hypothetical protein ACTSX0_05935 [Promethearchaeota archaeon]